MTEQHLTFRQLEDYAARRLAVEEIPAFHEHAESCATCRDRVVGTRVSTDAEHIGEQQCVDYVAGRLSSAETSAIAKHVSACESCKAMVDDLGEFRQNLQPQRSPIVWLMPLAAALVMVIGVLAWFTMRSNSGPAVIAQLRDGDGMLQLTQSGVLASAAHLPPGSADLIGNVLRTGHLPAGPADVLAARRETLRSESASITAPAIRIVSPDGIRVFSDRPQFDWEELGSTANAQVQIFDENFNEIAHSGPLHGSSWTPETSLPRSKPLLWQVTVIRNGVRITAPAPPEPLARFEVVSEDAARQISDARAAQPASHLLLAILYSQAGLRKEAATEADAVVKMNPGSALAASLQKR